MVDPSKIEVVKSWVRPTNVSEVRIFVGLAIYYHRFVKEFSSVASQLTNLTKQNVPFVCANAGEECNFLCFEKDLNLRKRKWMELLKDYDITILCHPGKANVVADAFNRKARSMGSLATYRLTKSPHFIPVKMIYNEEKLAKLFISEIIRLHGVPLSIISDRVLEDMLGAYVIDFGGHWDKFLPLAEFSYNISYNSSIDMAPFEALYGRRCRSPNCWFDAFEVRPWGTDLLGESLEKVKFIQEKLLPA
ncbi:uncharacterized protein [Solanum lycopersicum]|uniref:uncharacterized protein n=1 Tax=Solanum lycopersicum TaxID=4081 RepID=UPI0037486FB2